MDFKSLISKLDSIEAPKETPKAPKLPDAITLNEDATLRVLAGTSTVLKELDMNLIKAAQKGQEGKPMGKPDAESDKNVKKKYGYRMDGEPAERDDDETKQDRRGRKRQNKGESVEINKEKFQEKFSKMVEAKKSNKKEKMTDEGIISTPAKLVGKAIGGVTKAVGAVAGVPGGIKRAFGKGKQKSIDVISGDDEDSKRKESVGEAKKGSKPDFLDMDKDGDKKEPMKKAAKEAGKGSDKKETKGVTAAQKKLPPGLQKAIAAKKSKTESTRGSKKVVAESLDPILKFQDMLKLVRESGGQQQIDPLDKTLFAWATRVARNKLGEGLKAEVFAGMIYERNGGRFDMYDVLSEDRLDENWKKKLAAAGMAGVMGLGAMGGAQAADMPDRDSASDRAVASQSDSVRLSDLEDQVKDLAKVDRKAAKGYEASKNLYDKWLMKSKSPEDMKRADKDFARSLQTIIKISSNIN